MYQMTVYLFHSTLMFINSPFTVHFKLRGVPFIGTSHLLDVTT